MNVFSITNPEHNNELEFAESLLSRSMFNDKLFDRIYFKIVISLDDPSDYLYRILWESVYLNRSSTLSRYDDAHHRVIVLASLSEVIGYIYGVTPPRLSHLIPDSIKSISEINNSLTQFLMDENSGHLITHHSYFKKYMRIGEFETKLTYNKERYSVLSSMMTSPYESLVDVESSPFSLDELSVYDKEKVGGCIQITVFYKHSQYVTSACEMLSSNMNESIWEISNVYKDHEGIFITMFTTNYDGNMPSFIRDMISQQNK